MTTTNQRMHRALLRRQDFVAGLAVIGLAAFAFWQSADLPLGTLGGVGPGMLPRSLAVLLAALGALLLVGAAVDDGAPFESLSVRAPAFVLGAVVAFGLSVRPFGLIVAGPLAIVISAFASKEVRWLETIVVGTIMTIFCIGLFKFALGLPIPLAPWLIGY